MHHLISHDDNVQVDEEGVLPPEWTLSTSGLLLPPQHVQFHFSSRLTAYQVNFFIHKRHED